MPSNETDDEIERESVYGVEDSNSMERLTLFLRAHNYDVPNDKLRSDPHIRALVTALQETEIRACQAELRAWHLENSES